MYTTFEATVDSTPVGQPPVNLETLVNESREGNDYALDQLCAELMPLMGEVAARYDHNPSNREDHVQASIMKFVGTYVLGDAWKAEDGTAVPFNGSVKGLASVITRNTAYSAHRKTIVAATQERHEVHAPAEWFEDRPAAESVEEVVLGRQTDRIDSLFELATCPPEMSQVVKLLYIDGYKIKEVAEILGMPAGTVQSRASRGLSYLRTYLGVEKGSRMWDVFENVPDSVD